MNEQRRRELRSVMQDLGVLSEQLNHEAGGEDEAYDNMPESLQYTEKAQTLRDNAETLYDLEKVIDGVVEEIEKLISNEPED
mgnify:FL=1|tara:strand:+ start:652 stop:897 length:246 start_codon:yes stop_codon:yes gene_type:complete